MKFNRAPLARIALASVLCIAGAAHAQQQQTYKIGVNPAQTTPPAGHYTDTVSVVLSF